MILFDMLRETQIKPSDVFVDIGANMGQELHFLAPMGIQVYSYEPHPVFFEHLKRAYGNYKNVKLYNVAVSNINGVTGLRCQNSPTEINAGASIKKKRNCMDEPSYEVETIKASDEIKRILQNFDRIKVLKMDIEGSEYDVLLDILDKGLMEKVDFLYFEDHLGRIIDEEYDKKREVVLKKLKDMNIKYGTW